MKVIVHSHYSESEETYEGTPSQVYAQLIERFPHCESGDADHHNDVEALVEQIDSMQAYDAEFLDRNEIKKSEGNLADDDLNQASEIALDMIGFNPSVHPAFAGAKFLSGGPPVSLAEIRQALYDQDGDYEEAAIQAYHLPDNDDTRRALKSVLVIGDFGKAEAPSDLPEGGDIEPGTPDAEDSAEAVRRAFMLGNVKVAHLDGKHSKGSLIAKDHQTQNIYLLKPGSGGQSPAAGAQEQPASQSRREAAFWHVADQWQLGGTIPRADLVLIDGKEYAAIRMLPFSYRNLEKKAVKDPALAPRALAMYRDKGFLHKWAILDAVLGNPDRHGQNMMISADDQVVALIDHGSAFAGDSFDPAFDRNSFVPYYLRVWGGPKFNRLPVKDKLARMPSVSQPVREELRTWLNGIHADQLEMTLLRFGIDPRASVARLAKLKATASSMPIDQAVNRFWVTT